MYIWYSRQFTQDSFSSLRPRTEAVRISTRTKKKYDAFHLGKHANSLRSANGESIQQKDSAIDDHQGASGDGITLIIPPQKVHIVMPLVDDQSTWSDEQDAAEQWDERIETLLHNRTDHMSWNESNWVSVIRTFQ